MMSVDSSWKQVYVWNIAVERKWDPSSASIMKCKFIYNCLTLITLPVLTCVVYTKLQSFYRLDGIFSL
jgi:hypothetical protein